MTASIENKECFCNWMTQLGPFKDVFNALLSSMIGILGTAKALLLLVPTNWSDQLKKVEMQAEMEVLKVLVGTVEAPISYALNYAKAFSDCDPVANVTTVVGKIRNFMIGDLLEREEQLQMFIDAIDRESLKIQEIDNMIKLLTDLKEALDECGNATI